MGTLLKLFLIVLFLFAPVILTGCSQKTGEPFTMRDIIEVAKVGNLEGELRGRVGGGVEAGLKEAVYVNNSGSYAEFNFKVKFADNASATEGAL